MYDPLSEQENVRQVAKQAAHRPTRRTYRRSERSLTGNHQNLTLATQMLFFRRLIH